ncbi:ribonuclease HI [Candidatus Peregrinibacteria bacterium]|jgi:ribonuclease HI|nr:ribonuclease HI [Candidatus Peregrinibacteria bacterium]MBT4631429.1 ribonuclease HI [Candidatus Peregrinibacteria bacterium]MBT5516938.1 ribonuclease HI [Candidatus Peregrinibacteria bacterium]MBT5823986.1 ribonuclease HI [Candidatus Peregrinibacteria bacterium]
MHVQIFTDGSCIGNPGPGGWAAIIRTNGRDNKIEGGEYHTTNNRMELLAVIEAIKLVPENSTVELFTDSAWVVNTMTKGWRKRKNLDLWDDLDKVTPKKEITWTWVKGHSGHPENEDCDTRALLQAGQHKRIARNMDPEDLKLPGQQELL